MSERSEFRFVNSLKSTPNCVNKDLPMNSWRKTWPEKPPQNIQNMKQKTSLWIKKKKKSSCITNALTCIPRYCSDVNISKNFSLIIYFTQQVCDAWIVANQSPMDRLKAIDFDLGSHPFLTGQQNTSFNCLLGMNRQQKWRNGKDQMQLS